MGFFRNEEGKPVSGNKFFKFDSVIQLVKKEPGSFFIGDNEIDESKINSNDASVPPPSTEAQVVRKDPTETGVNDGVNFG